MHKHFVVRSGSVLCWWRHRTLIIKILNFNRVKTCISKCSFSHFCLSDFLDQKYQFEIEWKKNNKICIFGRLFTLFWAFMGFLLVLQKGLWCFLHACASAKMLQTWWIEFFAHTHKGKSLNTQVWTFLCVFRVELLRRHFLIKFFLDKIKLVWWRLGKFSANAGTRACTRARFRNKRDNKRLTC